jgi:glycerophosphoryl diester phosphodiesterase
MSARQLPLTGLYQTIPLVFAHRGARRQAPENTIAAFKRAVELGCDGIELDVQFCKDAHVVVFHDEKLGRTCGGSEHIVDLPLTEIRTLDAGSHFSPEFAHEPIPTLDEVFETVGDKLLINVEIKYFNRQPTLASSVLEIVRKHNMQDRVIISSFNPFILHDVRKAAPSLPIGFLHEASTPAIFRSDWVLRSIIGHYEARHPDFARVDQDYVQWAHRHRYRVNVWTVNKPSDIQNMIKCGVDAIISDVPDVVLNMRDTFNS